MSSNTWKDCNPEKTQDGFLFSQWDIPVKGPAKRKYSLTEKGRECLSLWMQTLYIQGELINRFLRGAHNLFPSMRIPANLSHDSDVSKCNL
jgi:DNA-binding PadR family transcriptional regulator